MPHNKAWQYFFRISALFNFVVGLTMMFATAWFFDVLGMSEIFSRDVVPWMHQFGLLVVLFGIGYWVVSLDPPNHRDIIWMGALGKLSVAIVAWMDVQATPDFMPFAILVLADAVLACVYARYLYKLKKNLA